MLPIHQSQRRAWLFFRPFHPWFLFGNNPSISSFSCRRFVRERAAIRPTILPSIRPRTPDDLAVDSREN
eukprot:3341090-Lingulodinium_polyedra.AAC.1